MAYWSQIAADPGEGLDFAAVGTGFSLAMPPFKVKKNQKNNAK